MRRMQNRKRDAHEEEKVIRKERDKTKEIQSVMTTDVPIHDSWKANYKDKNNITFLSVNINSLAHCSGESNRAERLKHIVEKYRINGGFTRSVHELGTVTPVQ